MNNSFRHHLGWWLLFQLLKSPTLIKHYSISFSLKNRFKSFKHAFNGFQILIREEQNARIHLFVAVLIIITSIVIAAIVFIPKL